MILATVQGLADQVVLSGEFPARDVLRQAITAVFQYGRTATMTV
jgi:hypothetical protein